MKIRGKGSRFGSSQSSSHGARIEIVPLIDIMFFLLATFVMVSTSMIKNKGIALNLPTAETGESSARSEATSISVTSKGEFFLEKTLVTLESLRTSLAQIKQNQKDPKVFINGDKDAQVSALVTALDEVRKAGISKVSLETTNKEK